MNNNSKRRSERKDNVRRTSKDRRKQNVPVNDERRLVKDDRRNN